MTSPATTDPLRRQLRALLTRPQAHLTLEGVAQGYPLDRINTTLPGLPYTAWALLEHLRFTQRDILNFVREGAAYRAPEWPREYWPAQQPGDRSSWQASLQQVQADLEALLALMDDPGRDLHAPVEGGDGQTLLCELLLVADHTSYHLGQLELLKRLLTETKRQQA
ncbi:DinB family protein [Deinococcus sonorensis]|uniref:DinB family protein n=2 Tax=Deinococcus sonorensis TaxID=309891 RepID=A0AAU7U9H3_9DEIO